MHWLKELKKETAEPNEPVQGSAEWLEERRKRFTGSEVHKLIGKPGNKTAATYCYQVAAERLEHYLSFSGSAATEWGNINEPNAVDLYEKTYKVNIETVGFKVHPKLDYFGSSLDGKLAKGFIEIKCPYAPENILKLFDALEKIETFKVRYKDYFWQVVAGFSVYPELEFCDFIVYSGQRDKILVRRIEKKEVLEEVLILEQEVLPKFELIAEGIYQKYKAKLL